MNPLFQLSAQRRARAVSCLVVGSLLAHAAMAQAPVTTFIGEQGIAYPPQDVEITRSGSLALVRAAGPVSAFSLPTTDEVTLWRTSTGGRVPIANCGPSFGRGKITVGYSSDALAIQNDVAVAIGSSDTVGGVETQTQIDVIRLAGGPRCGGSFTISMFTSNDHAGLASDVAISPDGRQAVVNHRNWFHILNLTVEPATAVGINISGTYPGPQSDSVAITDTRAIVVTTQDVSGSPRTMVRIVDITTPGSPIVFPMQFIGGEEDPNRPHDVAITPDGTKAVVTCNDRFVLFDLATGARQDGPVQPNLDRTFGGPAVPVDSVELTNNRAVLLGRNLVLDNWTAEVWDLLPSLALVAQFNGLAGQLPHDIAVRQVGTAAYAAIRAGNAALTPNGGTDVVITGIEAGATPTSTSIVSQGSPFGLPGTIFCSDSIDIAGVGNTADPMTLYAMSLGTMLYNGHYLGYARAINMLTPIPTYVAPAFVVFPPEGDGVPVDLALSHGGKDVLVRSYAPPTDANPAASGFDLMRLHVVGLPPSEIQLAATIGGTGDAGNVRLFAADSVASAGDYTVSIAELITGPNKGIIHFAYTGF